MAGRPNVDLRVLPLDAQVPHDGPPLNSFAIYSYSGAPDTAVVETETTEAQSTDNDQLDRCRHLYKRFRHAALNGADSLKLIKGAVT